MTLADIGFWGKGLPAAVLLLCGLVVCFGLVALKLQAERGRKVLLQARRVMFAAVGFVVIALLLLTAAFLTDDFSVAAVAAYSSAGLGFFYKLSAVWAGSAGSLLLWSAMVFVMFGLWLAKMDTDDTRFSAIALAVGAGVCGGFTALLVFVSKPFEGCPVTVDDGVGLNPLLQNFWNIVHPPLLFIGYSAFLIPFVIVLAAVFAGRLKEGVIYRSLRRWLLVGICFLSLGIVTGARWSYLELGWGGYWGWDAVENASLLPWLVGVAALHSLVAVRFGGRFKLWTVVLAPVPFILCLVATFITRSGILASVHSFGDNVMFSALLVFIGCCVLLWAACSIRAFKSISVSGFGQRVGGLDKSEILFWTNVIFIVTAVVIGVATFWPIIWRVVRGLGSSVMLSRAFYDMVSSMAGILLSLLVGLAALEGMKRHSGFVLKILVCYAAGLICFGLVYNSGQQALMCLVCGVCGFSFAAILIKLEFTLKAGGRIGGTISHFGLLLLVVAAGLSSNERNLQAKVGKGEEIGLGKYTIVYDSFKHKLSGGVTMTGPEIIVRKQGMAKRLWPHSNLYPNGQNTSEVAVHTTLVEDVYIAFDGVVEDGSVLITAKLKPLMLWLWLAFALIAAGPAVALLEGRVKNRGETG